MFSKEVEDFYKNLYYKVWPDKRVHTNRLVKTNIRGLFTFVKDVDGVTYRYSPYLASELYLNPNYLHNWLYERVAPLNSIDDITKDYEKMYTKLASKYVDGYFKRKDLDIVLSNDNVKVIIVNDFLTFEHERVYNFPIFKNEKDCETFLNIENMYEEFVQLHHS